MGEERTGLVTDSRAALEEAAPRWTLYEYRTQDQYDMISLCENGKEFAQMVDNTDSVREMAKEIVKVLQESSSLKLLLRAMCKGLAQLEHFIADEGTVWVLLVSETPHSLPVELDSSGIPVLTQEIVEALEAAK